MGAAICTGPVKVEDPHHNTHGLADQQTQKKLAAARAREIDREILTEKRSKKELKLLLLGTGESGKSTVLKQMRILHDGGFSDEEIRYRKSVVYSNLINGMADIITAMRSFGVTFKKEEMKELAEHIVSVVTENHGDHEAIGPPSERTHQALEQLWNDDDVKITFSRRSEFQFDDAVAYYLNHMGRICAPGYTPTNEDILYTRVATTGIVQTTFSYKNRHKFRVFDVGGQRSERRKWIHCFDNVDAVIFVTAISEYDQVLREDGKTNRILESLTLFGATSNSVHFHGASIILFLNKRDLFADKIRRTNITKAFPDYVGEQSYDACLPFIRSKFRSNVMDQNKKLYIHETCATDTDQVKLVIDSCMDSVIASALSSVGVS